MEIKKFKVENMGTGINKIRTLIKKAGLTPPKFEFGNFYTIIFPRIKSKPLIVEKSSEKIIILIKENPKTSAESLAQMIGISPRAVEKHLSKLKQRGILRRIGPDKGGYWEVVDSEKRGNASEKWN